MLSACSACVSGTAWSGHMIPHDMSVCVAIYNSAAATLTSTGLVCLGETATFSCTLMDSVLIWRYDSIQVGLPLILSTLTPVITTPPSVQEITFTVTHISNDDNILVSNLSFIADTATNGQTITCAGGLIREDKTIQAGSGKDHQLYQHSCS